jgi:transmembrane sensor
MNRFWNPQDDENRLAESAAWRLRLTEAGVRTSPEFEAWLREPGNQAAWDQVSRPWNYFDETDDAPAMVAAREAALADAKRNRDRFAKPQQLRRLAGLIAAALLIGAMGAGSVWWLNLPDDYRTAMGERRVITLSDGSKLSLDADSEVTVRYAKHDRALHLLKGQARFDVAHDKKRPFSVVAGNQRVIATGTAFNIDMAGPKVLVTLIEGHVLVLNENDGTAAMPMHPGPRAIELRAGQQLAATPAAPPEISPANIQRVTAWTIGQLMFDDEPLSSVVERVNRYGGTQIVIADPRVGAMKISGVFNAGDALGFVEIVTQYLPLKAVSDGSHTIALQREPRKNQSM